MTQFNRAKYDAFVQEHKDFILKAVDFSQFYKDHNVSESDMVTFRCIMQYVFVEEFTFDDANFDIEADILAVTKVANQLGVTFQYSIREMFSLSSLAFDCQQDLLTA